MADFIVRGFEAGDAPRVVSLHRNFNEWFEETELSVNYVNQCSLRRDFRFFVAESAGEVIGFCGVLFYESLGRSEIGPICIDKEFQNKKVGSLLVKKVMEFLNEKGVHRVTAKVKAVNVAGISFFEQNGFKKEALLERYTKRHESVVQMVKLM